jgi:hypothetical protein
MIKKILVTVIGFVLGLGVTTYVMVKNHKNVPPALTRQATDSSTAGTDTTTKHVAGVATDTIKPKPDSAAAHAAPTPTTEAATPIGAPVTPPVSPVAAAHAASSEVDPAGKAQAYKSVARIFASMKPTEAAQVLALLNDSEVEGILRAVGPKQAADFLINLPKERAAALSRRLLVPRADSGVGK